MILKQQAKLLAVALLATSITYTSCKKVVVKPTEETNKFEVISERELARQLALDLKQALSGQLTTGVSMKPNSISTGKAAVNSAEQKPWCGQTFKTSEGDTTYITNSNTRKENSIRRAITYICNSTDPAKWYQDGYNTTDTVITGISAADFVNYNIQRSTSIQNYQVRGIDINTFNISNGTIATDGFSSSRFGAIIVDSRQGTSYQLADVNIDRNTSSFKSGRVTFTNYRQGFDPFAQRGYNVTWGGFFDFLGNDTIDAYFNIQNEGSNAFMKYNVNIKTGEVSEGVKVKL